MLSACTFLSSCLIHSYNINDACQILEKDSWKSSVERASKKWQVPEELFLAFIYQESKYREDARPRRKRILWVIPTVRPSSAYGYAQALDGTWKEYKDETGKFYASRTDFNDAVDFIGWYVHKASIRANIPKTDVYAQYLAYHEGAGGYLRGTYRSKKWLMSVAQKVENYSVAYKQQMQSCL